MAKGLRKYQKYSKVFQSLSHPARLKLLHELMEKECCVGELQKCLSISQPNTSQHLKILRNAGIVKGRKDKNRICYRIADDKILAILKIFFEEEAKNVKS